MKLYRSGCYICGKELEYLDNVKTVKCEICGSLSESNAVCKDNHYICDKCHSQAGYFFISDYAENTKSKTPHYISEEIMKNRFINMHGPEHHYLAVAALLAAYKNAGGALDLKKSLDTAQQRARNVPGGICGFWGACGAGIGAGIFVSIITKATPLSGEEWRLSNLITSLALYDISQNGGPRCCKRNTFLSIRTAVSFAEEHFKIHMESTENFKCAFFPGNPTCKQENCLFYPAML